VLTSYLFAAAFVVAVAAIVFDEKY